MLSHQPPRLYTATTHKDRLYYTKEMLHYAKLKTSNDLEYMADKVCQHIDKSVNIAKSKKNQVIINQPLVNSLLLLPSSKLWPCQR